MKTTIFALGLAAIAAIASSTGASAFTILPLAQHDGASTLTPVTFFSEGYYQNRKVYSIDDQLTDYRTDRHTTEEPNYRINNGYWNKQSWNRAYCNNNPYSWRCQR